MCAPKNTSIKSCFFFSNKKTSCKIVNTLCRWRIIEFHIILYWNTSSQLKWRANVTRLFIHIRLFHLNILISFSLNYHGTSLSCYTASNSTPMNEINELLWYFCAFRWMQINSSIVWAFCLAQVDSSSENNRWILWNYDWMNIMLNHYLPSAILSTHGTAAWNLIMIFYSGGNDNNTEHTFTRFINDRYRKYNSATSNSMNRSQNQHNRLSLQKHFTLCVFSFSNWS